MEQVAIICVAIAPHCTYQEPEHFFSYLRDQLKKVQWSGIVSVKGRYLFKLREAIARNTN